MTGSSAPDASRSTPHYGAHVRFKARPGCAGAVEERLLRAAEVVAGNHGCRLYVVGRPRNDEDTVSVTELWNDESSHASSLEDDRVRAIVDEVLPLLAGPPEADVFSFG